jgi:hypothetical protein
VSTAVTTAVPPVGESYVCQDTQPRRRVTVEGSSGSDGIRVSSLDCVAVIIVHGSVKVVHGSVKVVHGYSMMQPPLTGSALKVPPPLVEPVGVTKGLTSDEDGELRRLYFLARFGSVAQGLRDRYRQLRLRDRRRKIRRPEDSIRSSNAESSG